MKTLSLVIGAASGTYRVPGFVGTMQIARSFETVPPSTLTGCLESLCGRNFGEFAKEGNTLVYGKTREPQGRGKILRTETQKFEPKGYELTLERGVHKVKSSSQWVRPVFNEVLFDVEYRVVVKGPWVESGLLDNALVGAVPRKGILCLGESDDVVTALTKAEPATQWLLPVPYWESQMHLPLKVNKNKSVPRPLYGYFKWSAPSVEVPEGAWLCPGGYAVEPKVKKDK